MTASVSNNSNNSITAILNVPYSLFEFVVVQQTPCTYTTRVSLVSVSRLRKHAAALLLEIAAVLATTELVFFASALIVGVIVEAVVRVIAVSLARIAMVLMS